MKFRLKPEVRTLIDEYNFNPDVREQVLYGEWEISPLGNQSVCKIVVDGFHGDETLWMSRYDIEPVTEMIPEDLFTL
jgi:hypothetical protein